MFERRSEVRGEDRDAKSTGGKLTRLTPGALGGRLLSEVAGAFLLDLEEDGLSKATLGLSREPILRLFQFLGCDPPVRELKAETPIEFLRWLRQTPTARHKQGAAPRMIGRASISAFLARPPRTTGAALVLSEQSIGRKWRHIRPLFAMLGLETKLRRRQRPKLDLPPVRLPSYERVAGWWQHAAEQAKAEGSKAIREGRRLILTHGILLLTGMRIEEFLVAPLADLEGHWLLLRQTKTRQPRVIYVNSIALGMARLLRDNAARARQRLLFDELEREAKPGSGELFGGWAYSHSHFSDLARRRLAGAPGLTKKPQQTMRQLCSTWMLTPPRHDIEAESLQLGHGSNLQMRHYVDVMIRLPDLLEGFEPPSLGIPWPLQSDALHMPDERSGGIWDTFRRLLTSR